MKACGNILVWKHIDRYRNKEILSIFLERMKRNVEIQSPRKYRHDKKSGFIKILLGKLSGLQPKSGVTFLS